MKYIVFRVYKSIFPLAVFAVMIVITVSYSIKFHREGYIPNQRCRRESTCSMWLLLAMSAVYYSIARLIVYSLPYYALSGAAAYLLVFMHRNKYDTTLQFVHNENIGTFYKLWDRYIQFWALKIGIAIAVAALMTVTYKIYIKRNMRTEY